MGIVLFNLKVSNISNICNITISLKNPYDFNMKFLLKSPWNQHTNHPLPLSMHENWSTSTRFTDSLMAPLSRFPNQSLIPHVHNLPNILEERSSARAGYSNPFPMNRVSFTLFSRTFVPYYFVMECVHEMYSWNVFIHFLD